MSRGGKRLALDETKRKQLLAILSMGCSQSMAAKYVGCSPSTIWRTAERDPEFATALREAKGNAELGLIHQIRNAAKKEQHWRAAAWALERLFPETYARRGPDVITLDQIALLLAKFSEIVVQHVPQRCRTKLLRHLDVMAAGLGISLKPETPDDAER